MKKALCIVFVAFFVLASALPVIAGDQETLQKAWTAYNVGRYKETLTLLHPLAQNGNPTAQVLIGRCYENGLGTSQNMETAAKWYALASEQNDVQGTVQLAYCYENGLGVPKDTTKAVALMKKAAEANSAEAQFDMAMYYNAGQHGLPKDFKESFAWAKKSADQGYAQAERFVGACYENGIGVSADQALAKEWYAKAQAKGLGREGTIVTKQTMPE